MKKLSILATLFVGLFLTASCDSDRDSNPTLGQPSTFVLNKPAIADATYDLDHAETFKLTTSQPDYGYTAATTYYIQASLHADMSDYLEVSSTSHNVIIETKATKLANTVTQLLLNAGKEEADFPLTTPLYLRLRASVGSSNGEGEVLSNIIELKSVRTSFCLPPVELPTTMYVKGSFNNWSWDEKKVIKMVQVNGAENEFWHLVYIDGDGIKFNYEASDSEGQLMGYEGCTITGEAAGDIIDNNGNIASKTPGWYLLYIQTELDKRDILYTVNVLRPNVWLIGDVMGPDWGEENPAGLFTVPTTADGEFVSPAFIGAGEIRAYVKLPGTDWWKSEFIINKEKGKVDYRGLGGDQYRVSATVGQKFYINFSTEDARVE